MIGRLKGKKRLRPDIGKVSLRATAIALAATTLAVFSGLHSFSLIAQSKRPDLALRAAPSNGRALSEQAMKQFADAGDRSRSIVRNTAKDALQAEPLLPTALFLIGSVYENEGKRQHANDLMLMAERLSRRDTATQLWLIESGTQQNQIGETLRHYDIALRSSRKISNVLFPILLDALGEEEIRRTLGPFIRGNSPWIPAFLSYAVSTRANNEGLAALLISAGGQRDPTIYNPVYYALINQLTADGSVRAARDLYLSLPGSSETVFQSTAFDNVNIAKQFTPLTWDVVSNENGDSFFFKGDGGRRTSLVVQLAPNQTALVARKVLFLRPGTYQISILRPSRRGEAEPIAISPVVNCFQDKEGKLALSQKDQVSTSHGAQGWAFPISADCSAQYLSLKAVSGTSQSFDQSVISEVTLQSLSH